MKMKVEELVTLDMSKCKNIEDKLFVYGAISFMKKLSGRKQIVNKSDTKKRAK